MSAAPETIGPEPIGACSRRQSFDDVNPLAERRTRQVMFLTAATMVVEIAAGWAFNSMALLADGWHMSSHAVALGLSALAYFLARRLASDHRFAFGTWKIEVLGGYTSALFLMGVVVYMAYASIVRLFNPAPISYDEAIGVAILGLVVNLCSAWLLSNARSHAGHPHPHGHAHDDRAPAPHGHHHDLNLRSAYLHVAADAATSVLAIAALVGGKFFQAVWLDPVMGLVGAALVATWATGLLRDTGRALLDAEMDAPVVAEIKDAVAGTALDAEIQDLHVWRVGKGKYAVVLTVCAADDASPDDFRRALEVHEELVHVTVEVNRRMRAPAQAHSAPVPVPELARAHPSAPRDSGAARS